MKKRCLKIFHLVRPNMGLPREEVEERARFAANMVGLNDSLLEKSPFVCPAVRSAEQPLPGFGNGA